MRSARLDTPGQPLSLVERTPIRPRRGQLVLAVEACAVCRTDLQLCSGDLPARRLPIVPGHQAVGRVAAIGSGVSGWKVGDRAGTIWLASACGRCRACRVGRENLCSRARFTGWDRDGGFADQVAVRAEFAVRLDLEADATDLAPLLCGGVIGYRALRLSGIQPGGRLGLYGFGASAYLALQVALAWGCRVHVATRSAGERRRATALGAVSTGGYDAPPSRPLDAAVTFAPAGAVVIAALRALAPGGTVAINAIHLDRIPAFDYALLWEERVLRSVANVTRRDAAEFLELARRHGFRTSVRRYPLAGANDALRDLAGGQIGAAAAVLETSTGRKMPSL
ncbi:MAG: zinc-binding alcohol dehydrogenase family protein [Candidatus Limnocylindria bacterium]